MQWLGREHGVRRWSIVGNDYVWPRVTARAAREYARMCDGQICHEAFVPLGWQALARRAPATSSARAPDAVLMLLVGADAVTFNRAFAAAGLDARCLRLSTLIDENTLAGSGAENTRGICAAAAYFETLATPESLDFGWRYTQRFGPDAPTLNSVGESCYEGILLLSALAQRAGSLDVRPDDRRRRVAVLRRPARRGPHAPAATSTSASTWPRPTTSSSTSSPSSSGAPVLRRPQGDDP